MPSNYWKRRAEQYFWLLWNSFFQKDANVVVGVDFVDVAADAAAAVVVVVAAVVVVVDVAAVVVSFVLPNPWLMLLSYACSNIDRVFNNTPYDGKLISSLRAWLFIYFVH